MLSRVTPHLRAIGSALQSVLYPELCLSCGAPARDALPVCAPCLRRLPRASREDIAAELTARGATPEDASRGAALWRFDAGGTVQRVQHALKYKGRPGLGVPLGALLATAVRADVPGWRPEVVAPVPLARLRELERGYNQAAGLAEGVAQAFGARSEPALLVRTRPTRTQTRLAFDQRWRNVDGAFALNAGADVSGLRVLLVDDVLTTGATLLAAAQPLRESGAEVALAALAFAA